jgi:hypothetical protein
MRFPIKISPFWKPLFTVLGSSQASSFVDLDSDAGTLRVKCGIWFSETFSIDEIAEVKPSSWPWYGGLGVKLGPTSESVSVVCSLEGIVAIRFHRPQAMHVLVVVNRPELRISLEDPEGFMAALGEAMDAGEGAGARAAAAARGN